MTSWAVCDKSTFVSIPPTIRDKILFFVMAIALPHVQLGVGFTVSVGEDLDLVLTRYILLSVTTMKRLSNSRIVLNIFILLRFVIHWIDKMLMKYYY